MEFLFFIILSPPNYLYFLPIYEIYRHANLSFLLYVNIIVFIYLIYVGNYELTQVKIFHIKPDTRNSCIQTHNMQMRSKLCAYRWNILTEVSLLTLIYTYAESLLYRQLPESKSNLTETIRILYMVYKCDCSLSTLLYLATKSCCINSYSFSSLNLTNILQPKRREDVHMCVCNVFT